MPSVRPKPTPSIGFHFSTRGGYAAAARLARDSGCGAYQYFPKNPRSLALKTWNAADAAQCAEFVREHRLQAIAHTAYPVNLAVEAGPRRDAVVAAVLNDLAIADACGTLGVVVHFGKYRGADLLAGYRMILDSLNAILRGWDGRAVVLLENQAGEGTAIGTTFEELTKIREWAIRPERVGFCLDTCHAFASGMWTGANWSEIRERGEQTGYFQRLGALHLNDSRYPSGSGRDRHEAIGHGAIGTDALRELAADPAIRRVPWVLETPMPPAEVSVANELARIRSLLID